MTAVVDPRTMYLRLDAPFAAFRWLQAGVFRGTFPVIPHSAAWGLALNLAGIETRGPLDEVVTGVRPDAPHLSIAVGLACQGERATLYQQLHGYPVGSSGKELQARARGQKYWIAPVKREFLIGMVAIIGVRGAAGIVERIPHGLAGTLSAERYGLPFAGDNQFLFSRIDIVDDTVESRWFIPLRPGARPNESTRLTTVIDRASASRTKTLLFTPTEPGRCPFEAWIDIGPAAPEGG